MDAAKLTGAFCHIIKSVFASDFNFYFKINNLLIFYGGIILWHLLT